MNLSGKDIFFSCAIAGLMANTVLGWALNKPAQELDVHIVNYEKMLRDAKSEFSADQSHPEMAQLNTGLFLSYLSRSIVDIGAVDDSIIVMDSSAVFQGPVTDITDIVYERAMKHAKENMGSDGILRTEGARVR